MSMSAVVYGQDLDRLAGFYCATLGVTESRRTRSFVVLSGSSYDLVLVSMPPELAAQVTVTVPPQRREDTPVKLTFSVDDIARARAAAAEAGGVVEGPEREWSWDGATVVNGHDPEGNVIQVRQAEG